MRRREFLGVLGGAVAAWPPLVARAQQPATPVIGYLHPGSQGPFERYVRAFHQGLREGGYIEGQNVGVEYRWADGQYDRLPAMAAELVARHVNLIVAQGGATSALAAKAASSTIPILFTTGGDPVKDGLVASFNQPGGNVTGVTVLTDSLAPKRLLILREVVAQPQQRAQQRSRVGLGRQKLICSCLGPSATNVDSPSKVSAADSVDREPTRCCFPNGVAQRTQRGRISELKCNPHQQGAGAPNEDNRLSAADRLRRQHRRGCWVQGREQIVCGMYQPD